VQRLELLSVAEDQRKCAWRTVNTFQVPELTKECLRLGINVYPIQNIGSWGQGFTHKTKPAIEGKPMSTYCIITKKIEYAQEYHVAFDKGNHEKQGKLLGFPKCCTAFFKKNWPEYFDPMPQIAENSLNFISHDWGKLYYPNTYSIPVLRYIGLRIGFHIPCSFNCQESIKIANERLSICKSQDDKDFSILLTRLLSMPIEWSVLHSLALIKTPIFYLRANSMPTEEEYIIRLYGDFIPRESASGAEFPFNLKETK
jgi:hypothetical protein